VPLRQLGDHHGSWPACTVGVVGYGHTMKQEPAFFISYSHADKDLAIALKAALVARGCAAWRDEDQLHVGDSLVERVADAVHEFE
jgi:hypothetical protein